MCYACGRPGHMAHQCAFDAGWYSKSYWGKKGSGYGKDGQGKNASKKGKFGKGGKKGKRKGMSKRDKRKNGKSGFWVKAAKKCKGKKKDKGLLTAFEETQVTPVEAKPDKAIRVQDVPEVHEEYWVDTSWRDAAWYAYQCDLGWYEHGWCPEEEGWCPEWAESDWHGRFNCFFPN